MKSEKRTVKSETCWLAQTTKYTTVATTSIETQQNELYLYIVVVSLVDVSYVEKIL